MADRYAGIVGATVSVEDGVVVLDLSTPEQPEFLRFRLDRTPAEDLAYALLDAVDGLPR